MATAPTGNSAPAAAPAAAPAPSAPAGGDEFMPLMPEAPPFGNDAVASDADQDLIMQTLFGGPDDSSGGDQGQGQNPSGGQSGVAAPSPGAPSAANQPGEPIPGLDVPAVPGTGTGMQPLSEPQQQGGAQQPQVSSPGQPAAASVPAQPAASPADPFAGMSPEARLRMQTLESQVTALTQALQQQGQPGQQPQQTGGQPAAQPGQPEQIRLSVPEDVAQAIFGEDAATARLGLNHLMSATATFIRDRVIAEVQPLIRRELDGFQAQQRSETEAEKMNREFYAAYPALNNDLIRPLVATTAQELYAQMPGLAWNETVRDVLGQRVKDKLQAIGYNVSTVQPPASGQQGQQPGIPEERPPVSNGGKPPAMMGAGTRQGADPAQSDSNFILQTLSG